MPVAEVATVRRGTAISAVYGTVRIEPAFVVHVRAQNSGFIQLAEEFSAGRGAIGKSVTKGQLLEHCRRNDRAPVETGTG